MKIIFTQFYLILVFAFISSSINGQDFSIIVENNYIVDTLGSEIIFEVLLKNNSSSNDISVTIVRYEKYISESWSSSLCFENCFAPFIDSISTSVDFGSSPLSPGESRTMSLHVFPLVEDGEAIIDLKFVNEGNPLEVYVEEFRALTEVVSVDEQTIVLDFKLLQNFPNPFNPSTTIRYTIPQNPTGMGSNVSLKVFDILGREVVTLVNKNQEAGDYSVKFEAGNSIPSGVYFYELKTKNFHQVKKMILEK